MNLTGTTPLVKPNALCVLLAPKATSVKLGEGVMFALNPSPLFAPACAAVEAAVMVPEKDIAPPAYTVEGPEPVDPGINWFCIPIKKHCAFAGRQAASPCRKRFRYALGILCYIE
jgi:hypothetical protein